jgi:ribosome maturation factor RimP
MVGPDEPVGGEHEVGEELLDLLATTVARSGLELVDLEIGPGRVKVVVDRPGGAPLDAIAEATRSVSDLLDLHDPMPGRRYTLELSSPGLERPLRTPEQFARAVGETVSVRTVAGERGTRRVTGRLESADDQGFVLRTAAPEVPEGTDAVEVSWPTLRRFAYDEVERARTVFEWGPARPGRDGAGGRRAGRADGEGRRASGRARAPRTNRKMTRS